MTWKQNLWNLFSLNRPFRPNIYFVLCFTAANRTSSRSVERNRRRLERTVVWILTVACKVELNQSTASQQFIFGYQVRDWAANADGKRAWRNSFPIQFMQKPPPLLWPIIRRPLKHSALFWIDRFAMLIRCILPRLSRSPPFLVASFGASR